MPRTFKSDNPLIDNALQAMYDTLFNPDKDAPEEHEYLEDIHDLAPLLKAEERDAVWLAFETVLTVLHFQNPGRGQLETLDILTLLLKGFNCSLYPLAMGGIVTRPPDDEPQTIEGPEPDEDFEEWAEIAELDALTEQVGRQRTQDLAELRASQITQEA
ncbi:MAG TPA: hypothetical protein DCP69_07600 [Candidatus Omnitrophica bacterium]|nr:hypothetical protein [Candidatus Omnitrophota bacterium]